MAGCFGNSMYDREMERQLMQHLNEEAYEEYRDNVVVELDETMWNTGLEKFFNSDDAVQQFIDHCFNEGHCEQYCANGIVELYKMHTI